MLKNFCQSQYFHRLCYIWGQFLTSESLRSILLHGRILVHQEMKKISYTVKDTRVVKTVRRPSLFFGIESDCLFRKEFLRTYLGIFAEGDSKESVLLLGPAATGKTNLAYQIWKLQKQPHRPFIRQDCLSIKTSSELQLLFKKAKGGDLFLEGLHYFSSEQFFFLKEFMSLDFDVRVIASLNTPFELEGIKENFSRMICIPPLRERRDDIRHSVTVFLQRRGGLVCTPQAMDYILKQEWKTEYEGLFECLLKSLWFACSESRFYVTKEDIKKGLSFHHIDFWNWEIFVNPMVRNNLEIKGLKNFLRQVEAMVIAKGLVETDGNLSELAKYLQIPLNTLVSRNKGLQKEIDELQILLKS